MLADTKEKLISVGVIATLVGMIGLTIMLGNKNRERTRVAQDQRKETVCPSFLSIARSARDTLIVMRNEPLCDRYVLDNLK